jgi:hypothetical protein
MSVALGTGSTVGENHGSGLITIASGTVVVAAADANRCLILGVAHSNVAVTAPTCIFDAAGANQAMTLLGSQVNSSNTSLVQLWGLLAPATSAASKSCTLAWTGSSSVNVAGAYFTGVDQGSLAASVVFSSAAATGTGPTLTFSTAAGNADYSIAAGNATQNLTNPGAIITSVNVQNSFVGYGQGYILSAGASDTHLWHLGGSVPWAEAGVLIYAVGQVPSTDVLWAQSCF